MSLECVVFLARLSLFYTADTKGVLLFKTPETSSNVTIKQNSITKNDPRRNSSAPSLKTSCSMCLDVSHRCLTVATVRT
jgi:hypothetical protein